MRRINMRRIRLNALLTARVNEFLLWNKAMENESYKNEYIKTSKLVSKLYSKVCQDLNKEIK